MGRAWIQKTLRKRYGKLGLEELYAKAVTDTSARLSQMSSYGSRRSGDETEFSTVYYSRNRSKVDAC